MPRIVVLGAGVCGLATAMMLARDGHDVTVLERDPAPVPESAAEAWEGWARTGVSQFRQAHYLHARVSRVLEQRLPDVRDALLAAGAVPINPLGRLPPEAGDERLSTITARRTTLEHVFARAAEAEPRVEVRRGTAVASLAARNGTAVPHVTGVHAEGGEEIAADLVVDAMGRRSRLPEWLRAAGAASAPHEEAE